MRADTLTIAMILTGTMLAAYGCALLRPSVRTQSLESYRDRYRALAQEAHTLCADYEAFATAMWEADSAAYRAEQEAIEGAEVDIENLCEEL